MAKVTQEMIARQLGISRTAVACGLGLYRGKTVALPEETRKKILKTAQKMGYRPNRFAQRVAGRATGVIGVLSFGGISQIATLRVQEISRAIQDAGYDILLYETAWYSRKNLARVAHALLDNQVEALVLIEPTDWFDFSLLKSFSKNSIPVVSLGGVPEKGIPHVTTDEYAGMFELVSELIHRGSRHLALLSSISSKPGAGESPPVHHGGLGFTDAVAKQGGVPVISPISQLPEAGIVGELINAQPTADWSDPYLPGYTAMDLVLQNPSLPDTLVCQNDDWAFGVLRRCRETGLRVPEDIKIAGNDGIPIAAYGETPLTTLVQPLEQMSNALVELILLMLKGRKPEKHLLSQKFPPQIVWRRSTGSSTYEGLEKM